MLVVTVVGVIIAAASYFKSPPPSNQTTVNNPGNNNQTTVDNSNHSVTADNSQFYQAGTMIFDNGEKEIIKNKEWYEYCNNEQMLVIYRDAFKHSVKQSMGDEADVHYVRINSTPEKILEKPYLSCKVNLAYKVVRKFDYNIGTIDLLSTIKGFDENTGTVMADFATTGENSTQGNIMNEAMNGAFSDFKYDNMFGK